MSCTPDLISKDDRGFPSREEAKWEVSVIDLPDQEIIHEMPLALFLGVRIGDGNYKDKSVTASPRSIERAPTIDKGHKVGFLVLLAINFRYYPYKLVDGDGIIVPSSLQVTKALALEAAHLPAFNHNPYLLWQPTGHRPELPTIRILVQTTIEH